MNVVEKDRHTVAWRFGQTNISRNHTLENLGSEETPEICGHLLGEGRAVVVHRQEDTFDREGGIDRPPEPHKGVQEFGHPLQGQILALDRDQDRIASRQRIHGQEIERRWAVNQDVFVLFPSSGDHFFEAVLAVLHGDQFDGGSDQVLIGRNQIELIHSGINRDPFDRLAKDECLIKCPARRIFRKSQSARGVRLRVRIDDEGVSVRGCEGGSQIDCRRGFPDTALLVGDGNDSCQEQVPQ